MPPAAPQQPGPDPFAWMRDKDRPDLREYLAAERAYYDEHLARLRGSWAELRDELIARVPPEDESVHWARGGRRYFTRTRPGQNYPQFCRIRPGGEPEILLDQEALLADPAATGGYVELGVREVSPDGRLLAYSVDFDGDELYQLRIRDLDRGVDLPDRIDATYYGLAWSADSRTLCYTLTDAAYRPHEVWRHQVGTDPAQDVLVYREDDERYDLFVAATRSGEWILIEIECRDTTETLIIPAADPARPPGRAGAPAARHRVPRRPCHRPGRRRLLPGHQRRGHRVPAGRRAGRRGWPGRVAGGAPGRPGHPAGQL